MFRQRPDWSRARQAELASGLKRIASSGLDIGPGKISLKRIRREDWAESWKLHFKPMVIGSALLLKPSWSRRRPRKGQAVIVLDPGLSFGTGRHPTTAFCLRQLVAAPPSRAKRSPAWTSAPGPAFWPSPPPNSAMPRWTHLILIPRLSASPVPTRAETA